MPNYRDIGSAFGDYYDGCVKFRDAAFDYGGLIVAAITRRGEMPPGVFKLYSPDPGRLNLDRIDTLLDALRYNSKTRSWDLSTLLVVRREKEDFPIEAVRVTFTIQQEPEGYTLALLDSDVSVLLGPPTSGEPPAALDDFADRVLAAFANYYMTRKDRSFDESTKHRMVWFGVGD